MSDYKFDTFYYTVDKTNEHSLSEIENLSDADFICLYKGKIKCPECMKPLLSLVKKEGAAYLRTYPNQPHGFVNENRCTYGFDTASKKLMEKYVEELRKKKKIKSLLEGIMRKLFKQDMESSSMSKINERRSNNPLLIERIQSGGTIKRNIIPHYSFKSWGKNIPQDQLLIIYGKVYIDLKEINKKNGKGEELKQTYIHFKDISTKKLITSCIKPKGLKIDKGNYYAVVLGECCKNESKGYIYYNIWINAPIEESVLLQPYQC